MRGHRACVLIAGLVACGTSTPRGALDRPAIGNDRDRVIVEVLNASGDPPRAGLARLGTRVLREAGVDVVFYGTADTAVDTTLVLVRRGETRAGDRVARALGSAVVRSAPDSTPRVDVTVLLGRSWTPPRLPAP